MIEKRITNKIMAYLRSAGFYVWKQHGGPYQQAGLPDIIGCYRGRMWAIEVKRPGQQPRPHQQRTIDALRDAGASAHWVTSLDEVKALVEAEITT